MMAAGWPRSALAWACLACVVGFSTDAAEPGEVERGLPGPVGRLVACETKMLGCLVDEAIEEIPLVRDERGRDDLAGAASEDVLERALALRHRAPGPATVHFRTGDAIAAVLLTADEAHVRIRIATDREATIPVGFIRAVELAASVVDGDMLAGEHPALGPVRVPLAGCAELLIGAAIDEYQPAERPCDQWVLSPAASTR